MLSVCIILAKVYTYTDNKKQIKMFLFCLLQHLKIQTKSHSAWNHQATIHKNPFKGDLWWSLHTFLKKVTFHSTSLLFHFSALKGHTYLKVEFAEVLFIWAVLGIFTCFLSHSLKWFDKTGSASSMGSVTWLCLQRQFLACAEIPHGS